MSIIFKCEKCKNTFQPGDLFLEGKILEKKSVMLPIKAKQPMIMEQPIHQIIHLCSSCVSKFRVWLEEEEKS